MSRTSYGVIAFKIPHPEGTSEADMVLTARRAAYDATEALRKYGAIPSTLEEVQGKAASDNDRLGEMGVTESNTKYEGELNGEGEK